nr:hypothetical protein [Porphyrobacter sp. GA68]
MLRRPVHPDVAAFARRIAQDAGAQAVLFYGSNLRTGSLDGVLDFYVLLPGPQGERVWPRIGYREFRGSGGTMLRAKTATLSLVQFARAASGDTLDTTIWTRFVQPSALIWTDTHAAEAAVIDAVADAARRAATLAAALGPVEGQGEEYWRALFQATYRAEFRVEAPGRENSILSAHGAHFSAILPLAWQAAGVGFASIGENRYRVNVSDHRRAAVLRWWRVRRRAGRPLNILRLVKAAGTFDGAADYAAWKVRRHTGIALDVTPFRRRHPVLSMPGAALELWRKKRRAAADQRK